MARRDAALEADLGLAVARDLIKLRRFRWTREVGGPDNLLSGWPQATGGHRERSASPAARDLLFARDAARANPDKQVIRATQAAPSRGTRRVTWKAWRP